jgi:serine/threonine protein kinase/tetratricopeptide (TPR) repeat protein
VDVSRWQRVKELFSSTLEREPAHRSAFLEKACGEDQALRQEVESLLAVHEEITTTPGIDASTADATPAEVDSFSGRRIGPYQVVRRIGQGGMATVYLAVRADDQYRKQVAIKIIPQGLDNQELLRRFRNERQTLAALDHPNVVRLLDGGSTEDGLPYLVMDYVEGSPLDEYGDNHKLSTDERLRLFLNVCAAVQYAHQRLVIHRDLKPGNILVTADGTVKLLDFGIAKLLNPEAAATLVVTRTGQRAMTPEYASPEQVRGEPLTNATDVYSLGVVLYELLTGHHLYRSTFNLAEIERAICEDEPIRPSTVVTRELQKSLPDGTTQTITANDISRRRRETDARKLRSRLSGDLDAIVMTALRKEPQRRYSSVYEFAEDIRRHLEGLPVKARPSSGSYRLSKFFRRHREATLAALIALLFVGGMLVWEFHRTHVQSGLADQPGSRGNIFARRSIAVLGFKNLSRLPESGWLSTALSEMLATELGSGGQMRTIRGETVAQTKRDLSLPDEESLSPTTLTNIRQALNADFVLLGSYLELDNGQIRLDLRVQDTRSGNTLAEMSETGMAADLFELVARTGTKIRERLGIGTLTPDESLTVKASLPSEPEAARLYAEGLAMLRRSDALGALAPLEKAAAADAGYPLTHRALAEAWAWLGYDEKARSEAKDAFDLSASLPSAEQHWIEADYWTRNAEWDKALGIYRDLLQSFPDNVEYGLQLAKTQVRASKPKEALITLATLRRLPRPAGEDPRIDLLDAQTAEALGDFQREQASGAQAAEKARRSGARLQMADALVAQGVALWHLGQLQLAAKAYDEAIENYRELHDQRGAADALANKAVLLRAHGDLIEAKSEYEKAAAVFRELGTKSGAARMMSNIAEIEFAQGHLPISRKTFEESLQLSKEAGDQGSVRSVLINIAEIRLNQGDVAGAKSDYQDLRAMAQHADDLDSAAYASQGLGNAYYVQGDLANAEAMYSEALEIRNRIGEKESAAETQLARAELSLEQGLSAEAETFAREASDEFHREQANDDEIAAHVVLARAFLAQGKIEDARKQIDATGPLLSKIQNHETEFKLAIVAARVLRATGKTAEARNKLIATLAEARKSGFLIYQFESRLALGEIEMQAGRAPAGRSHLRALQQEANAKGFLLIARKAADAARVI